MSATKFLDPKNDYAFKKIFGTEKNKDILVHFLNDILCFQEGEKIRDVVFLKPVQDPEVAAKKQSIVDVLCKDEKGVQYIVEMQVARFEGFAKRAQYYAAKAYTGQMNNGDTYHNLKQVIFLAITDFVMFPQKKGYKSDHVILDKESAEQDLKDFSFTFLELPKFNKELDALDSMVEKWIYFFKHASHSTPEEIELLTGTDTVIQKAYKVLDQHYWTDEEMRTYEQERKSQLDAQAMLNFAKKEGLEIGKELGKELGKEIGKEIGREEGKEIGREEGKEKAMKEVAAKLLAQGLSLETIVQVTGLSSKEVGSLK